MGKSGQRAAPMTADRVTQPDPVVRCCVMCGASGGEVVREYAYEEIWRRLAEIPGVAFDEDVIARHTPAPSTALRRCQECGLQSFIPALPGDGDFYETLSKAAYYEDDRWEFGVVAQRLRGDEAVVDVGCGRGGFLGQI